LTKITINLKQFGFAIYDHPSDIPDKFVARRWYCGMNDNDAVVICDPTEPPILAHTLEDIRLRMRELKLQRIDREPADDPVIIECWI